MKKRSLLKRLSALALLSVSLTACTAEAKEAQDTDTNKEEIYQETIQELEQTLRSERESAAQNEELLQREITELRRQLAILGATATPPGEQTQEMEFTYRVEDGRAVITGYRGTVTLLAIPNRLDGYPVAAIGERAFEGCELHAVVLPDGVESIGWFAFYGCEALSSVTLPSSISSIGYAVFDGCRSLTVVCPADSYAARYAASYGLYYITT